MTLTFLGQRHPDSQTTCWQAAATENYGERVTWPYIVHQAGGTLHMQPWSSGLAESFSTRWLNWLIQPQNTIILCASTVPLDQTCHCGSWHCLAEKGPNFSPQPSLPIQISRSTQMRPGHGALVHGTNQPTSGFRVAGHRLGAPLT